MDALDAGAEDFDASEDAAEVTTDPENYSAVVSKPHKTMPPSPCWRSICAMTGASTSLLPPTFPAF